MKWKQKKMILVLLVVGISLVLCVWGFMNRIEFGKYPEGERLEAIRKSPNFANGEFKNQISTPMFTDDSTVFSVIVKSMFTQKERLVPEKPIPIAKTDLRTLDFSKDIVIWLGHSSYYLQLAGKRILIDPVFSTYASPFFLFNRAFDGTNLYQADEMPDIDYLLITHDHWDHLDYPSVKALESRVGKVICGLGVGSHLRAWGYPADKVTEADWFTTLEQQGRLQIHVLPARHFFGRGLIRNRTLWVSFALQSPEKRLFISGDTGYGPHLKQIGEQFGSFDLAILENGQYDKRWAYIHMMPEETAQAAIDLRAQAVLPSHSGKFAIANHAWDDPLIRLAKASEGKSYRLLTPLMGEAVDLDDKKRIFMHWWES